MAGRGYKRSITLDFDVSQMEKGTKNVEAAMKVLDSEFKKSAEELKKYGTASQQLSLQKDALSKKVELQRQKVTDLQKKYDDSAKTLGEYNKKTLDAKNELNKAEIALSKLEGQLSDTNKEINKQNGLLGGFITKVDDFKAAARDAGVDIDKLAENFVKVGLALTGLGVMAANAFIDFDREMSKTKIYLSDMDLSYKELENAALRISRTYNIAAGEVAKASYYILDVGVEADRVIGTLGNSALLAETTFTDFGTATELLTRLTKLYNLSAEEELELVDKLFVAQKNGRISIEELNNVYKNTPALLRNSKISADEYLGAMVFLTTEGTLPAKQALSAFSGMINTIQKPSAEAAKAAKEMGLNFDYAALNSKGLEGFLEELRRATNGQRAEVARLFPDLAQLDAVMLMLPQRGGNALKDNIEEIRNVSGEATRAFEILEDSASRQLSKAFNGLKTSLIEGGSAFDGVIRRVAEFLDKAADISPETIKTITVLGGLALSLGVLAKAFTMLKAIQEGILLVKGLYIAITHKESVANGILKVSQIATSVSSGILAGANKLLGTSFMSIKPALIIIALLIVAIAAAYSILTNRSKNAAEEISKSMKDVENNLNNMSSNVNSTIGNANSIIGGKARGGPVNRSGKYLVGEEGPEIVDLQAGSHVYTAQQTRRMLHGGNDLDGVGTTVHMTNHITVQARDISEKNAFENFLLDLQQSTRQGTVG